MRLRRGYGGASATPSIEFLPIAAEEQWAPRKGKKTIGGVVLLEWVDRIRRSDHRAVHRLPTNRRWKVVGAHGRRLKAIRGAGAPSRSIGSVPTRRVLLILDDRFPLSLKSSFLFRETPARDTYGNKATGPHKRKPFIFVSPPLLALACLFPSSSVGEIRDLLPFPYLPCLRSTLISF